MHVLYFKRGSGQLLCGGGGYSSTATSAIAIGGYVANRQGCGIAIGYGTSVTYTGSKTHGFAIGCEATITNSQSALAFGRKVTISDSDYTSLVGHNSSISNSDYSTLMGYDSTITNSNHSLAIGSSSTVTSSDYAIALGYNASTTASNAIALGSYAVADEEWTISVGGGSGQNYKIVNMAAGEISATSTDAINGSQLYETNQRVGTLEESYTSLDSLAVKYDSTDKTTVTLAGTEGTKITNVADGEISETSTDAVNGSQLYETNQRVGTLEESYTSLDSLAVKYDDDTKSSITLGGEDGTVITNVAAGAITARSTDAVNGSQIYSLGNTIAGIFGDGWSFVNGTLTGSWSIGGNTYTSLTAILTDIKDTLDSLSEGWNFGTSSSTTSESESSEEGGSSSTSEGTGSDSGTSQIRAGDTLIVEGGRNVVISGPSASELEDGSTEHTYTISVSDNPEFDSVTVADGTVVINENGISISNSEGDTTITINGDTGIDMGWTNITNVGNLSADTINVNQSLTIGDVINISNTGIDMGGTSITNVKSIQIGDYTISETSDGYDFGGGVITNIGDGGIYSGSTDVVTGNQLWEAYQAMNNMGETLKERINLVGAHAAALSGLHPIQYNPDEPTTLSASVGTYRDKYAVAVGAFHYVKDNILVNVGASIASDGDLMGRMGVSLSVGPGGSSKKKATIYQQLASVQNTNKQQEQLIVDLMAEVRALKEEVAELKAAK